jgi:hypothetical protein
MSAFEGRILKYSLLGGGVGVVLLLNQKLYIQLYAVCKYIYLYIVY